MSKIRNIKIYKDYFKEFYLAQPNDVRKKINYSLWMVENQHIIPAKFFKYISGSDGIYEVRAEYNGNIYRVFCCMDEGNIVVLFHGFQKKTQKTPHAQIKRAEELKREYLKSKGENK